MLTPCATSCRRGKYLSGNQWVKKAWKIDNGNPLYSITSPPRFVLEGFGNVKNSGFGSIGCNIVPYVVFRETRMRDTQMLEFQMTSDDMENQTAGEKYFNKYSLSPYAIAIMLVMHDVEPQADILKLIVGAGFVIIWTLLVGIMTTIFIILPIAKFLKQTEFVHKYFLWLPPIIGFGCFLLAIYG